MGLTNFPHGITSFGVPILPAAIPEVLTGNVFFVDSGKGADTGSSGKDTETPFATIDYAIGRCTANNGDVIYVMPGHTESVIAASGITCDVAGVSIIGLGKGGDRPTVTLSTATTATVVVSAASVLIRNILFVGNLDNIATCLSISGKDCTIDNCEFRDTSDALHFLSPITTGGANTADRLTVTNCKCVQLATAATAFIIASGGAITGLVVKNNYVNSAATGDVGHFIIFGAVVILDAEITDNICDVTGATNASVGIFMTGSDQTMTGVVARNYCASLDTTTELFCTATMTFALFENYYTGTVNAHGKLWPAVDGA